MLAFQELVTDQVFAVYYLVSIWSFLGDYSNRVSLAPDIRPPTRAVFSCISYLETRADQHVGKLYAVSQSQ